ncbi:conserved hypothetical protein [Talaromyces stipitatus ATCC 10500]|uniref:Azaphilone pigments biosynthesis cluster protein L N-terminal domain-containing protein n=1 Tax=Talaromyces stipitatus (strain ATCC 10500 / CBS 375.48 / QM 6759 / NRRL 1006) TaxID=441959 RepID=B8MI55_TALSN|nr:uncharacterized protein TSTA_022710 [Talaromyces stipitatus ATCC 10500]EED17217.1 conserved hypothetical protein [Talaromyces stipitatus ATCC 10500]
MADPLSVAASVLAVVTAAAQSTRSLYDTIRRFQDRSKTLRRLQDELEDLANILSSLAQVVTSETTMLELLQRPIDRCSQVCRDFEASMKTFSGKSKPGFRDWTKMEFMRGDINDFIDTIAEYKSTISVGLGTINLHTSKISHQALQEYNEMIQDTVYNLELRLRRIDEKMAQFPLNDCDASSTSIDLKDERAVTQQCIRVCKDARSYIESLISRDSSLLPHLHVSHNGSEDVQGISEAQQRTRQVLDESQSQFEDVIGHLQRRLQSLLLEREPNDTERLRLQEDIDISRQCLEVCKTASEVSRQKIYRVGEVVADGESDQVVVTTLADLFDVKKASSKGNSAQLVGSMTPENLRHLTEERYKSRFGALAANSDRVKTSSTGSLPGPEGERGKYESRNTSEQDELSSEPQARHIRPSSNEIRKRATGGDRF